MPKCIFLIHIWSSSRVPDTQPPKPYLLKVTEAALVMLMR